MQNRLIMNMLSACYTLNALAFKMHSIVMTWYCYERLAYARGILLLLLLLLSLLLLFTSKFTELLQDQCKGLFTWRWVTPGK